jgi:outer membrane lipoprotein carrier protein
MKAVIMGAATGLIVALAAPLEAQQAAASASGDGSGLALLEAAATRYEHASSLCADFSQTLEVPLLGDERSGTGRLCQARPNLFAMRFTEPDGDAVVADGSAVWVYYPSTDPGQVLKLPIDQLSGGYDFHRTFLSDPASKYRVEDLGAETVDGHATRHLELHPRSATSGYRKAEVWIDDGTPVLRRIRITQENQSVRTVTLDHVKLGATAPEGWFAFTPPAGVQVITR